MTVLNELAVPGDADGGPTIVVQLVNRRNNWIHSNDVFAFEYHLRSI